MKIGILSVIFLMGIEGCKDPEPLPAPVDKTPKINGKAITSTALAEVVDVNKPSASIDIIRGSSPEVIAKQIFTAYKLDQLNISPRLQVDGYGKTWNIQNIPSNLSSSRLAEVFNMNLEVLDGNGSPLNPPVNTPLAVNIRSLEEGTWTNLNVLENFLNGPSPLVIPVGETAFETPESVNQMVKRRTQLNRNKETGTDNVLSKFDTVRVNGKEPTFVYNKNDSTLTLVPQDPSIASKVYKLPKGKVFYQRPNYPSKAVIIGGGSKDLSVQFNGVDLATYIGYVSSNGFDGTTSADGKFIPREGIILKNVFYFAAGTINTSQQPGAYIYGSLPPTIKQSPEELFDITVTPVPGAAYNITVKPKPGVEHGATTNLIFEGVAPGGIIATTSKKIGTSADTDAFDYDRMGEWRPFSLSAPVKVGSATPTIPNKEVNEGQGSIANPESNKPLVGGAVIGYNELLAELQALRIKQIARKQNRDFSTGKKAEELLNSSVPNYKVPQNKNHTPKYTQNKNPNANYNGHSRKI